MDALYAIAAVAAAAIVVWWSRRSIGTRRSIDLHQKTMGVLGGITVRAHDSSTGLGEESSADGDANTPASPDELSGEEGFRLIGPERLAPQPLGSPPASLDTAETGPPTIERAGGFNAASMLKTGTRSRPWLRPAVLGASVLILAGLIGIVSFQATKGSGGGAPHAYNPGSDKTNSSAKARSSGTTSTTSTTIGPSTTGKPILTSIVPLIASAGDKVTLVGSGFTSANGNIVAYFGKQVAPTACSTEELCVVTVPPESKSVVQVRLMTQSGESNALTFTYG